MDICLHPTNWKYSIKREKGTKAFCYYEFTIPAKLSNVRLEFSLQDDIIETLISIDGEKFYNTQLLNKLKKHSSVVFFGVKKIQIAYLASDSVSGDLDDYHLKFYEFNDKNIS